jgi:hypothetical protein
MFLINEITNESKQRHHLVISKYNNATLTLEFKPSQNGWFYSIEWQTFSVNNLRIVNSANILRQWVKIIPFGIGILTKSGQDPMTVDAFSSGEANLYLLTSDDTAYLESLYV